MRTVVITKEREKKRKVDVAVWEKDGIPVHGKAHAGFHLPLTSLLKDVLRMVPTLVQFNTFKWYQHWSSSILLSGTNIGPVEYLEIVPALVQFNTLKIVPTLIQFNTFKMVPALVQFNTLKMVPALV